MLHYVRVINSLLLLLIIITVLHVNVVCKVIKYQKKTVYVVASLPYLSKGNKADSVCSYSYSMTVAFCTP